MTAPPPLSPRLRSRLSCVASSSPSAVVTMAAREVAGPGLGSGPGGGEGRTRGQRRDRGSKSAGRAATWDAAELCCRGRRQGDLQPALRGPRYGTPIGPPRERDPPLRDGTQGDAWYRPPLCWRSHNVRDVLARASLPAVSRGMVWGQGGIARPGCADLKSRPSEL